MKMRKTLEKIASAVLAGTLASGSLAQTASKGPEFSADSKVAYVSGKGAGLDSQTTFKYSNPEFLDLRIKGLVGTQSGLDRVNYGLDMKFKPIGNNLDFRVNLGYSDVLHGEDLARALFSVSGENNSFAGVSYQHLPEGDHFNVFGGMDIVKGLHLQGTFDNSGNARGVLFTDLENIGLVGLGGGVGKHGQWDANVSYNNDFLWASAKFGKRPLDVRFVLGDVPARNTFYFQNVSGSGINELDDGRIDDQTFKFDIGKNGFFDYFGVEKLFLNERPGSAALEFRFRQDQDARLIGSYRIGDVGPMNNWFVAPSVRYDFPSEKIGFGVETGFNLFDKKGPELRFKVERRNNETVFGIMGGWSF